MKTNDLNRAFIQEEELSVIVSELTYIKIRQKWHYVCVFVNLFNREIIDHSVGETKVYATATSIRLLLFLMICVISGCFTRIVDWSSIIV